MKTNNKITEVDHTTKEENKTFATFFRPLKNEVIIEEINSGTSKTTFKDFFDFQKNDSSNTDTGNNNQQITEIMTSVKRELDSISNTQTDILKAVKTVKEEELSVELKTLFKKEKIDISDARKAYINIQLDELEEDLKDDSYTSKTKLISKFGSEKLKKQSKLFQPVLKPIFINKLRNFNFNTIEDASAVMTFISQLSSYAHSVKRLENKTEAISSK